MVMSEAEQLKRLLGEKYSSLVIDSPKDEYDAFINDRLRDLAADLIAGGVFAIMAEHKLKGFLKMSLEEMRTIAKNDYDRYGNPGKTIIQ